MWLAAWMSACLLGYMFLSWVRRWVRVGALNTRHVLVVGCDSGLGLILAQRLDMLQCHVLAACSTPAARQRLAQVTSRRTKAFVMDTGSDASVRQGVDHVTASLPENAGLWGVVLTAGELGPRLGPVEWLTVDDFQVALSSNCLSGVRVVLGMLPLLKAGRGRVVAVAGVAGRVPPPHSPAYSVSLAALATFTDSLRPHLAQYAVTVHLVEPGAFQIDIGDRQRVRKAALQTWKAVPWTVREEFGEQYYEQYTELVTAVYVDRASPKVNHVIKAFMHALTARCPRTRYTVGWDATLLWIPLSYLPAVVSDTLFARWMAHMVPAGLKVKDGGVKVVEVKTTGEDKVKDE